MTCHQKMSFALLSARVSALPRPSGSGASPQTHVGLAELDKILFL
jgi:hypothetical protein